MLKLWIRGCAAAALAMIACAVPAIGHACSLAPQAYDLVAYWAAQEPGQVVFQAQVRAVSTRDEERDGYRLTTQRIEFQPVRWWRGGSGDQTVTGEGRWSNADRTSCAGVFDFSVREGQEWLIVGHMSGGVVHPSRLLSVRLADGTVPKKYTGVFESAIAQVETFGLLEQDSATGKRRFTRTTDIPLKLGNSFAVWFKIEAPGKKSVRLKSVFLFPYPGIAYPGGKVPVQKEEDVDDWPVGELQQVEFSFDARPELLPGGWTWELWDGDTLIADRRFRMVREP